MKWFDEEFLKQRLTILTGSRDTVCEGKYKHQ